MNLDAIPMSGIEPTDVWDLTRAEIEGRQQVMWAVDELSEAAVPHPPLLR